MSYSRLQLAWLTAAENAAVAKGDREFILDVTNYKVVLHDGATVGGRFTLASEAYVQTQVAQVAAGNFQNLYLHAATIYP